MPLEDELLAIAEDARRVALGMVRERGRETLLLSDRPLGSFGARIALAARLALIDAEVELALTSLRRLRNAFAHTADEIRLADPAMRQRLAEATSAARRNPLWSPLEAVLSDHFRARGEARYVGEEPALRDYVLLITMVVIYLETAARTLQPLRPSRAVSTRQGIGPPPSAH